jgi:hypothetical protein
MGHDFFSDDENLDDVGTAYEERDPEVNLGKKIARDRKCHALVGDALDAKPLDDNDVTDEPKEYGTNAEAIIGAALPIEAGERAKIKAAVEKKLPKAVRDEVAKKQRTASYDAAMKKWSGKLKGDDGMREASGFQPKGKKKSNYVDEIPTVRAEPMYIKESIERGHIKGDKSRLNETLAQFYQDFNGVADAFGVNAGGPDHAMSRDAYGKLIFEGATTYDLKKRAVPRKDAKGEENGDSEMGSENSVRVMTKNRTEQVEIWYGKGYYDKTVKTVISDPGAVDNAGYSPGRGDLLLGERVTDTKHCAEEVAVAVGPLLPYLKRAVLENATAEDIGKSLGKEQPYASPIGNTILTIALEAAADAYDRIRKRERSGKSYKDWIARQPNDLAIPARKVKQSYDTRSKVKADAVAIVDQAMAANDNARVARNNAA